MPHRITREQAMQALQENHSGDCLLCRIFKNEPQFLLEKNNNVCVFLSAYPRFWGQIMIAPMAHVENFSSLDPAIWETINRHAHKAARILEKLLSPARVYIASLGAVQNFPMTCPHIHINVVPVPDEELKPSEVFTWANGLYDGTEEEWKQLFHAIKREWESSAS